MAKPAEKAIHDASMDRFRPILMTTLAAVFGAMPIALGFGADGASRRPLGLVIVGGLIVSQFITLFITPVIYLYLEEFQERVLDRMSFFPPRPHGRVADSLTVLRHMVNFSIARSSVLALFLVSASCTVGPDYRPPSVAVAPAWLEAWNTGIDSRSVDLSRWWTEFNDPILDSLVDRAVQANLDLAVAQARIREARGATRSRRRRIVADAGCRGILQQHPHE